MGLEQSRFSPSEQSRKRLPSNSKATSQLSLADRIHCDTERLDDSRRSAGRNSVIDLLVLIEAKIVLLLPMIRLLTDVTNRDNTNVSATCDPAIQVIAIEEFRF